MSSWYAVKVEISFDDNRFEEDCNNHRSLVRGYGDRMARVIRRRLDDLDAAETLEDMRNIAGRCHELLGDRTGQLSLDLVHPQRLIFVPEGEPIPRKPDGGLDWTQIRSVRILGIEDTHE